MWQYNTSELYHFGIKGMRWGVRRYQNDDGTLTKAGHKRYESMDSIKSQKTGDTVYIGKRRSKSDTSYDYDLIGRGKKIGELMLNKQGDNLYVNWIGIKNSQRGRGYASSVMDYVVKTAKNNKYKTISLEVPDISPDARHIYEKHGFVASERRRADGWGGLTDMKRQV